MFKVYLKVDVEPTHDVHVRSENFGKMVPVLRLEPTRIKLQKKLF
jgi:hypothetical protein